jgi:hypothetical protein
MSRRPIWFVVEEICVIIAALMNPYGCANKMSRFEALRDAYALPTDVKPGRTEILRAAVQGIYENFVLFMETPVWSFKDLDGLDMPYISIGRIEGGEFRLGKAEDFAVSSEGVNFSINIVIDEAVDQFPKAHIHFCLTVDEHDGALTVTSHSAASGPVVFTGADFTPVSQHLHEIFCSELAAFKSMHPPVALTT